ncbi:MAG: putative membrane protein [Chlamydiales bacterium]|jgi:uncharacterized membrane protein
MQRLIRIFLKGLTAVLPTFLTLYALWWLGSTFESMLGRLGRWILPEGKYVAGLGLVIGFVIVFTVGLLVDLWVVRKLAGGFRHLVARVPLVKSVYGALHDMMRFFRGDGGDNLGSPVLVTIDGKRLVGFVTRRDAEHALPGVPEGCVAVYLPMSYQLGGFLVMLPEDELEPVDMRTDEAMRVVLTAGIGGGDDED